MRNIKYFLFSLICLFNFSVVFAEGEVIVKNVSPVYDAESTIVVTENENSTSVVFNDKAQSVLFKVVLENTTNKDLPVDGIELSRPSEDFLLYKLDGLNSDDVIKANSTKELTISLETIKKEGWGRNFNDELVASISFDTSVLNPNTSDNIVIISLIIIGAVAGFVFLKKYKVARYGVIVIAFFSFAPCIKADFKFVLPVTIDASYESQNVMMTAGNIDEKCKIYPVNGQIYEDCWYEYEPLNFWEYNNIISNIYFENNLSEHLNYTHKFDVSEKQNGKVTAYLIENDAICTDFSTTEFNCYDLYLQSDGIIYANEDGRFYFYNMFNLESINNIEGFDTSKVTNMSNMFAYAGYNSSTLKLDLSNFDTSDVTDMSDMFMYVGSNSTIFELDISGFDTSKVTDMGDMFRETGKSSESFTLDVSKWDTSNVKNMSYMFSRTGYNSKVFTLDVSNFDTSNVTDMKNMFREAGYNSKVFTLDLSNFDTSNVTDMGYMFFNTGYNSTNFSTSITIKNPNISNYSDMFSSVAIQPGSKIIVNYTSETEALVDDMIATKSANSNVVKGELVD